MPVSASVWCLIITDSGEEDPPAEDGETEDGCDAGIAASLFRPKREPRFSVVGALGTWSVGIGAGWTFARSESGTAYGVALGVVAPWDSRGVDVSEWGVAVGATLSLTRRGGE
jgi:hypothetical protein